jgi:hypothetical protein
LVKSWKLSIKRKIFSDKHKMVMTAITLLPPTGL